MATKKKSQYRQELEQELKPLLQEANMKLLNLETLSKQKGFERVKDYAYYNAMRSIKQIRGEEYKRFNMPKNTHQLEKTLKAVEKFLGSTTSSKKGIIEVYENNAASLNRKFGSNMGWQEMGQFLRAAGFEDLKREYDSQTAVIMLKRLFENRNLSKEDFIDKLEKHQIRDLDEVNSDTLADFVETELSWEELFPIEE